MVLTAEELFLGMVFSPSGNSYLSFIPIRLSQLAWYHSMLSVRSFDYLSQQLYVSSFSLILKMIYAA